MTEASQQTLKTGALIAYRVLVVTLLSATTFFSLGAYQAVSRTEPAKQGNIAEQVTKLMGAVRYVGQSVEELKGVIDDDKAELAGNLDDIKSAVDDASDSAKEASEACGELRYR